MEFLTRAERNLALNQPVFQVDAYRNQRLASGIHRANQFVNFLAVEQELPLPAGWVILKITVGVFANMSIIEPDLPFFYSAKGLANLGIALADRFDLGALQHETRLKLVPHKIIVVSFRITDLTLMIR